MAPKKSSNTVDPYKVKVYKVPDLEADEVYHRKLRAVTDALNLRQWKNARKACDEVLSKYPGEPLALSLRAITLDQIGRQEEAIKCLEGLTSGPGYVDAQALHYVNTLCLKLGLTQYSVRGYKQACAVDDKDLNLLYGLQAAQILHQSPPQERQQTATAIWKLVGGLQGLWTLLITNLDKANFGPRAPVGGIPLQQALTLASGLSGRMIDKYDGGGYEIISVHLDVLQALGQYDECIKVLDKPICAVFDTTNERQLYKACLYIVQRNFHEAAQILEPLVVQQPQNWQLLHLYLNCVLPQSVTASRCKPRGVPGVYHGHGELSKIMGSVEFWASPGPSLEVRGTDEWCEGDVDTRVLRVRDVMQKLDYVAIKQSAKAEGVGGCAGGCCGEQPPVTSTGKWRASVRGPLLAKIEVTWRELLLRKCNSSKLMDEVANYVIQCAHLPCAYQDIGFYLSYLSPEDSFLLCQKLQHHCMQLATDTVLPANDTLVKVVTKVLQACCTIVHVCSHVNQPKPLQSHIYLTNTTLMLQASQLATQLISDSDKRATLPTETLTDIAICQYILKQPQHSIADTHAAPFHDLTVLLTSSYIVSSALQERPFSTMLNMTMAGIGAILASPVTVKNAFNTLDIKNPQIDSVMGQFLLPASAAAGPLPAGPVCEAMSGFFLGSGADVLQGVSGSIRSGSFSKVYEMRNFKERLDNSLSWFNCSAMTLLHTLLSQLYQQTILRGQDVVLPATAHVSAEDMRQLRTDQMNEKKDVAVDFVSEEFGAGVDSLYTGNFGSQAKWRQMAGLLGLSVDTFSDSTGEVVQALKEHVSGLYINYDLMVRPGFLAPSEESTSRLCVMEWWDRCWSATNTSSDPMEHTEQQTKQQQQSPLSTEPHDYQSSPLYHDPSTWWQTPQALNADQVANCPFGTELSTSWRDVALREALLPRLLILSIPQRHNFCSFGKHLSDQMGNMTLTQTQPEQLQEGVISHVTSLHQAKQLPPSLQSYLTTMDAYVATLGVAPDDFDSYIGVFNDVTLVAPVVPDTTPHTPTRDDSGKVGMDAELGGPGVDASACKGSTKLAEGVVPVGWPYRPVQQRAHRNGYMDLYPKLTAAILGMSDPVLRLMWQQVRHGAQPKPKEVAKQIKRFKSRTDACATLFSQLIFKISYQIECAADDGWLSLLPGCVVSALCQLVHVEIPCAMFVLDGINKIASEKSGGKKTRRETASHLLTQHSGLADVRSALLQLVTCMAAELDKLEKATNAYCALELSTMVQQVEQKVRKVGDLSDMSDQDVDASGLMRSFIPVINLLKKCKTGDAEGSLHDDSLMVHGVDVSNGAETVSHIVRGQQQIMMVSVQTLSEVKIWLNKVVSAAK